MKVKGYLIDVEGLDKSGKDLIKFYITQLTNYKYVVQSRGILSNMVYAEKFNRQYNYTIDYKPIVVYLDVDKDDWEIRCKLNNEPKIDYDADRALYMKYLDVLIKQDVEILSYNTSKETPINIAKSIIRYIEAKNSRKDSSNEESSSN